MYRYSQTLPGGPITLVGILVLSFLIPGWVAGALGFSAANAQLVEWILSHHGIFCIALLLLYGLGGFVLLVAAGMTVFVGYVVLIRAVIAVKNWAMRTSVAVIRLLCALLCWSVRTLGELVWDQIQCRTANLTARWHEGQALRRIYREEYAEDFPSYRAFLRHWRALTKGTRAEIDPVQQATRLMGLPEDFSRDDLRQRFRILIAGIHPDRVGPNELATQLIAANTLISERRNWT